MRLTPHDSKSSDATRRVIKLGDRLEVQVAKVDRFKKQVDFRLVQREPAPRSRHPQPAQSTPFPAGKTKSTATPRRTTRRSPKALRVTANALSGAGVLRLGNLAPKIAKRAKCDEIKDAVRIPHRSGDLSARRTTGISFKIVPGGEPR